ncbi:MAG: exo-alpha-sialidase, partial [Spirochaetales bacterium]|nr:exo-alpha-sialidase [Spirochaetales bacterium]
VLVFTLAMITGGVFADVNLPTEVKANQGPNLDLLDPIHDYLSGRPWLIAEGLDPGLASKPGWDVLTRQERGTLNGGGIGSGGGVGSSINPSLQASGGGFLVPFRSPGPAFSRDLLISRDMSGSPIQTEPTIAVNPDDPDHIVVAMIDYNFPSNSSYVSYDAGATWEGPNQTGYLIDDRVSGGDPVLAFDSKGNIYMTSISIGVEEFSIGPVNTSSVVSSIALSKSSDGGYSWPQIISTDRSKVTIADQQIDPSGRLRGTVSAGFLDKPWMAIGPNKENPAKESIYLSYIHFETFYDIVYTGELPLLLGREMSTTVKLVRSDDEGLTWTDPVNVSPTVRRVFGSVGGGSDTPGMFGSDRVLQGGRPTVDSLGNVYVAWLDSTDDGSMEGIGEYHFASSTDGGVTFSEEIIAATFNELPFQPRNAFFRYWGGSFPRLEAGTNGELYLVYTARPSAKPADDGDVFFIRSLDRGETWSTPIALNDDEGNSLQFFPEIAVGPDGVIHVMWGDMRDDPAHLRYHIYYTTSTDSGETWGFELEELSLEVGDTRVSDFSTNPNRAFPYGLFLGDYFGIAASEEDVYMVWADGRLAEFGGVNQKIAFSRGKAMRSPDIYVSPSAGAGGQNITVQGFNFQPDMNIYIQLQDATISIARTNREGRFSAGIYIPITGEGAQNLRVFDESGNFATTSFYTEFGFGTIQSLYEDLLEEVQALSRSLED